MSEHKAVIKWTLNGPDFKKGRYSREHTWTFDGGLTVPASASPQIVPKPYSNPEAVDPEESFVAALSSCHMLSFLYLASRAGLEVTSYEDEAVGVMDKNEQGATWISTVTLHPKVSFRVSPSAEQERQLHDQAHHDCFIANSVKTQVLVVQPAAR
jgi:organic hydroperoxide reductase OsmC/OhrA